MKTEYVLMAKILLSKGTVEENIRELCEERWSEEGLMLVQELRKSYYKYKNKKLNKDTN